MSTKITDVYVQHPDAAEVRVQKTSVGQRSLNVAGLCIVVGGYGSTPESLREEAAALAAIADAATELAHWCEDRAGDVEAEQLPVGAL